MNTQKLAKEVKTELTKNILPFWQKTAKDTATGGFFGAIDNNGQGKQSEWRGIVMVSRFLWTYSAAARLLKNPSYMTMADYAHTYMMRHFWDPYYGGMFWSVKAQGEPLVVRKQIYGDAFSLYALSEYAAAVTEIRHDQKASSIIMNQALDIFELLETYTRDTAAGGYFEARERNWEETAHTKLSPKDIDCEKSMNTNLHVMEAYTNLYRTLPVVFPEKTKERETVGKALEALINVHIEHILDKTDWHLNLYFDKNWKRIGEDEISYGHDIEASWLLWEAAEELGKKSVEKKLRPIVLQIASVSLEEGLDNENGGFENTMLHGQKDRTRIWWNQAEALNGFFNAWEMTSKETFARATEKVWSWIKTYQKDKEGGDWFWAVDPKGKPKRKEVKGGNWKTSYHNARCCMELLRRIERI